MVEKNTKNKKVDTDESIIFAPADEIKCIEQVINNLETVSRELQTVAERMKPVSN
jgi:hypothetical protein